MDFEDIPDASGEVTADPFSSSFGGEQQSFGGEQQSFGGEQQSFGGEQQQFVDQQQKWQSQTSFPNEEPSFIEPQQAWSSEGSFGGDMQQQQQVQEEQQSSSWMPEPEQDDALSVFNKTWQAKLETKRAAEMEAEKAVKVKANDEMGTWMTQRDIRLRAKKDTNRSEEQVLLETLESESDANNNWERVAKLIDVGDAGDPLKADVSRMHKLFIQLKNEPLETSRATNA